MAEALSSDVGDEVKKTLGTIQLGRRRARWPTSDDIVLGAGSGTGLHGGGPAGGGTEEGGVPFGSGTLDTGWVRVAAAVSAAAPAVPAGRGLARQRQGRLGGGDRNRQRRRR